MVFSTVAIGEGFLQNLCNAHKEHQYNLKKYVKVASLATLDLSIRGLTDTAMILVDNSTYTELNRRMSNILRVCQESESAEAEKASLGSS